MLKTIKLLSLLLIVVTITSSCKDDTLEELTNAPDVKVFGFENYDEAKANLGVYADIFSITSGSIFIRNTNVGSLQDGRPEVFARFNQDANLQNDPSDGGIFKIGDNIVLKYDDTKKVYLPENQDLQSTLSSVKPLLGKDVYMSLTKDGKETGFNQYIPQDIFVNYPEGEAVHASMVNIPSQLSTKVFWNADYSNDNGVVFFLWWNGATSNSSERLEVETVEKAILVEDNGTAEIPANFFAGIPSNAVVTLYSIRGAIDIKTIDQQEYKFYSVSQNKYDLHLE